MNACYDWNKETGKTSYIIEDKKAIGVGYSICHPDDTDVMSARTGGYIAELRAEINYLQNYRSSYVRPGLNALTHLYSTMNHSQEFNEHSYEAKRIRKEIKNKQKEINEISIKIENLKIALKEYIDDKEKMAQYYRTKQKIQKGEID